MKINTHGMDGWREDDNGGWMRVMESNRLWRLDLRHETYVMLQKGHGTISSLLLGSLVSRK